MITKTREIVARELHLWPITEEDAVALEDWHERLLAESKLISNELRSDRTISYESVRDELLDRVQARWQAVAAEKGFAIPPRKVIAEIFDGCEKLERDSVAARTELEANDDAFLDACDLILAADEAHESGLYDTDGHRQLGDALRLCAEYDLAFFSDPGHDLDSLRVWRAGLEEAAPRVRAVWRECDRANRDARQAARETARAERLAAHRQPAPVIADRKCSACKRRPARVDDLCKRCARAAGILVHGKIGEG